MANCEICKSKINETFLGKLEGTIIKTTEGEKTKLHYVCKECQKEFGDKIKEKLK